MNKRISASVLSVFLLTSCAGAVLTHTPIPQSDGSRVYSVYTVYGLVDGDRMGALKVINREARRVCSGDYEVIQEHEHDRITAWGAKNGQTDLTHVVKCIGVSTQKS